MEKLSNWLHWINNNLLYLTLGSFIVATAVVPKIPIQSIEYTYIKFRIDDIFPAILGLVFVFELLRRKVTLNTKLLPLFILFWVAIFASFYYGMYIHKTIPQQSIGLLHSLRRIEYMFIFFVASSAVISRERFYKYMNVYFISLLIVCIYGIGQKYLHFPSIQSMNPAYADGRWVFLQSYDRINSTFGGHFDLAAYVTFSMPILLGFYFIKNELKYFLLFAFSLLILLFTAMRSSFAAYILAINPYLLINRKFKIFGIVTVITVLLTLLTGQMIDRFLKTVQTKTVYENTKTGGQQIDQKVTASTLPAGQVPVPIINDVIKKVTTNTAPPAANPDKIQAAALNEALAEAKASGKKYNGVEIEKRTKEIAKYIQPKQMLLCDISCSTRLQVEWPRAIGAFMFSPLLGTGPSSITEATDNDILRWLGETGLIGTGLFVGILAGIAVIVFKARNFALKEERLLFTGFIFGLFASLLNAFYVDIFEASKFAYNFWIVAGLYVGFATLLIAKKDHGTKTTTNPKN